MSDFDGMGGSMFYSLKTIIKSLPKKKNSKSSLWVKMIIRKLSFLFTFIFINLGFSAWAVSVLSVFVAITGCVFLCINSFLFRLLGVILIEFWLVLDCVDGNIARVKKTSSEMGEFIDALSGYFVTAFVYFSIGVAAFHTSFLSIFKNWNLYFIYLGSISTVCGILSRLIHQKYTYSLMVANEERDSNNKKSLPEDEVENKKSLQYIRSRLDKEISISGLFMPFLIFALIFNIFDIMTIFYLSFQALGLVAVTFVYSMKAR